MLQQSPAQHHLFMDHLHGVVHLPVDLFSTFHSMNGAPLFTGGAGFETVPQVIIGFKEGK